VVGTISLAGKLPLFDKVLLWMDGSIGALFLLVKGYFAGMFWI
jgi:hypothetical protein